MKTIKITSDKKISAIKNEFNEMFPFLKLEFFKKNHSSFKGSLKKDILNTDMSLSQYYAVKAQGGIVLRDNMKVEELEKLFMDIFGVSVQVFRKSGNSWIETTVTDDWSLKQQNDEGEELSSLVQRAQ